MVLKVLESQRFCRLYRFEGTTLVVHFELGWIRNELIELCAEHLTRSGTPLIESFQVLLIQFLDRLVLDLSRGHVVEVAGLAVLA